MAADAGGDRPVTAVHWLSATDIAAAYAAKTLSPVELMTALLGKSVV